MSGSNPNQPAVAVFPSVKGLPRLLDWNERLTNYLLEIRGSEKVLDYSVLSCAHLASGAVEASLGVNMIPQDWPRFTDAATAAGTLRHYGFAHLGEVVDGLFNEYKGVLFAQRGDLALLDLGAFNMQEEGLPPELKYALGIVESPFVWVLANRGLMNLPLKWAVKAYKVGL